MATVVHERQIFLLIEGGDALFVVGNAEPILLAKEVFALPLSIFGEEVEVVPSQLRIRVEETAKVGYAPPSACLSSLNHVEVRLQHRGR
jgi:hypothetical protein